MNSCGAAAIVNVVRDLAHDGDLGSFAADRIARLCRRESDTQTLDLILKDKKRSPSLMSIKIARAQLTNAGSDRGKTLCRELESDLCAWWDTSSAEDLVEIYASNSDIEGIRRIYELCRKADQNDTSYGAALAICLAENGRTAEADKLAQSLLTGRTSLAPEARVKLCQFYEQRRNITRLKALSDTAVPGTPEKLPCEILLARGLEQTGQATTARLIRTRCLSEAIAKVHTTALLYLAKDAKHDVQTLRRIRAKLKDLPGTKLRYARLLDLQLATALLVSGKREEAEQVLGSMINEPELNKVEEVELFTQIYSLRRDTERLKELYSNLKGRTDTTSIWLRSGVAMQIAKTETDKAKSGELLREVLQELERSNSTDLRLKQVHASAQNLLRDIHRGVKP